MSGLLLNDTWGSQTFKLFIPENDSKMIGWALPNLLFEVLRILTSATNKLNVVRARYFDSAFSDGKATRPC